MTNDTITTDHVATKRRGGGQAFSSEKRGQTFYLHAWELTLVGGKRPGCRDIPAAGHPLADPDVDLPVDMSLVASIRMRGQRQAIEVRKEKVPEELLGKLREPESMERDELACVVFGRQRTKAIHYINETDGLYGTDAEILVECKPTARGTTLQDAAEDSMIENGQRREVRALSVIAKAKAYLAQHGDDEETLQRCAIANRMTVDRLKELLDFAERAPAKTMKALKDGDIGIQAAVNLIKLPAEQQAEVIAAAKADGKKVSSDTARAAVRVSRGKSEKPTAATLRDLHKALKQQAEAGNSPQVDALACIAYVLGEGPEPDFFGAGAKKGKKALAEVVAGRGRAAKRVGA